MAAPDIILNFGNMQGQRISDLRLTTSTIKQEPARVRLFEELGNPKSVNLDITMLDLAREFKEECHCDGLDEIFSSGIKVGFLKVRELLLKKRDPSLTTQEISDDISTTLNKIGSFLNFISAQYEIWGKPIPQQTLRRSLTLLMGCELSEKNKSIGIKLTDKLEHTEGFISYNQKITEELAAEISKFPSIMDKIREPDLVPSDPQQIKEFVETLLIISSKALKLPIFEIASEVDIDTFAYNHPNNRVLINYDGVQRQSWKEAAHGVLHEVRHAFQHIYGDKFNRYIEKTNIQGLLDDQTDYLKDEEILLIQTSIYKPLEQFFEDSFFRERVLGINTNLFSDLNPSVLYNHQHHESDSNRFAEKVLALLNIEYP